MADFRTEGGDLVVCPYCAMPLDVATEERRVGARRSGLREVVPCNHCGGDVAADAPVEVSPTEPARPVRRAEPLLKPADLTRDALERILVAALFDVTRDEDDDLVSQDPNGGHRFYALPSKDGRLLTFRSFAFPPRDEDVDPTALLRFVNRVNDQLNVVRAAVTPKKRVVLDWGMPVDGGVTERAIALAARRWLGLIGAAIDLDTDDLLR